MSESKSTLISFLPIVKNKTGKSNKGKSTHRLRGLDGHKPVVALLPTDIAKGAMIPGVLGNVADLMD